MLAMLAGCLNRTPDQRGFPPAPDAPAGPRPDAGPEAPPPPAAPRCHLVDQDHRLCLDRATCPVRAAWQLDCDDRIERFALAITPGGQVLASVEARGGFALEGAFDRAPVLTEIGYGGGLVAAFTVEEPPRPRFFSSYGIVRPGNPGWQLELVPFVAPLAGARLVEGEAGFVLLSRSDGDDTTLSLAAVPLASAPVMVARGAIVHQQLLVAPDRAPVVIWAERQGPEILLRQWRRGSVTDLARVSPHAKRLAFSATLGADGSPAVLYDDDGSLFLVRDGVTSALFVAPPVTAPKCDRCVSEDSAEHYSQTDTGERASPVHALDGNWMAAVTGPGIVYCRAQGCINEVVTESTRWSLRLRNLAVPGSEVVFHRQWPDDPIALEADGAGRLYLAWKDLFSFHLLVLDPAAF